MTGNERSATLTRAFSRIAIIEAFTWAALLIGMYFKYIPRTTELGVRIFGSLHGAAFIAYVIIAVLVARRQKWSLFWTTLIALAAAVPPFMTVVFESWARRRGILNDHAAADSGSSTPRVNQADDISGADLT